MSHTCLAATLRPSERLRRRSEFQAVHERGTRAHGRYLALYVLPTNHACSRIGIAASRRLGGAVTRNRAKRVVRAVFREHKPARSVDVVAIVKQPLLDASFAHVVDDFCTALARVMGRPRRSR